MWIVGIIAALIVAGSPNWKKDREPGLVLIGPGEHSEFERAQKVLKGIIPIYREKTDDTQRHIELWLDGEKIDVTNSKDLVDTVFTNMKRLAERRGGFKEQAPKNANKPTVVELTSKNFDREIQADPDTIWFVKFYAPWCGHCKSLEPTWKELAAKVHNLQGKIRIAKVDATVENNLASRFSVQGNTIPRHRRSPYRLPNSNVIRKWKDQFAKSDIQWR